MFTNALEGGRAAARVHQFQGVALSGCAVAALGLVLLGGFGWVPAPVCWALLAVTAVAAGWILTWLESLSAQLRSGTASFPAVLEQTWACGPLARVQVTPTGGARAGSRAVTATGQPVCLRLLVWSARRGAAPVLSNSAEPSVVSGSGGKVVCSTPRGVLIPLVPGRWDAARRLDAGTTRSMPR